MSFPNSAITPHINLAADAAHVVSDTNSVGHSSSSAANAAPQTPAAQSPQDISDTANAVSQTPPVHQGVLHENTPAVPPFVAQGAQAAQSEHKSESLTDSNLVHGSNEPSDCALAGGAPAPQSPQADELSPSAKKPRRKRRDNHVSVRFDDTENEVIARRMERTGETQSQAVRAIIRESEQKTGHVYLSPKAPPEQLETLLGVLGKWRRDFAAAKPRLNMATPKDDVARHAQVQAWRKEAERVLAEIPKLEDAITAAANSLTSLTPERVTLLKSVLPKIKTWYKRREEKGEGDDIAVQTNKIIVELIESMGITDVKGGK